MAETLTKFNCRACGDEVPAEESKANLAEHGDHIHTACLDTRHTFYAVNFDGEGGPSCESRESAESFIAEDVENHNSPDITAANYSITPLEETWREYLGRGEWDGY